MIGRFLFEEDKPIFHLPNKCIQLATRLSRLFGRFELLRVFSAQFFIHERKTSRTDDRQTDSVESVSQSGRLVTYFLCNFFIHKRKK